MYRTACASVAPGPFASVGINRATIASFSATKDAAEHALQEAEVTPGLREHVWNELAPQISAVAVPGSEKYEAAAKVAEWQGLDVRHVADLLLRAAWCCVDEGDIASLHRVEVGREVAAG